MPHFPRLHALLTAATLLLALPAAAQQQDVRLPDLGSSADALISPQEAQQYGREMLGELRAAGLVLDDPLVDEYLQSLGYRLASHSADPGQHYTFVALGIPEINAFASPGGYIYVFSGLITITDSQDELAAVLAHELAHISQHHLQRAYEDQKKSTPLYVLGAIAAAVAAGKADSSESRGGVYNPYAYDYNYGATADPSMGAFYSVLALMEQHQIDFTRKDEEEADHVGIATLARAGFDPEAMAEFFQRMQNLLRPGGEGGEASGDLPPFLQDHPVNSVRIADAKARAHVIEQQMRLQGAGTLRQPSYGMLPLPFVKNASTLLESSPHQGRTEYALIRERVRVLTASNPHGVLDYYTRNMARDPKFAEAVSNRYGYALALVQSGDAAKAVGVLQPLLAAHPGNLTLELGLAWALRQAGQRRQALEHYASLNAMWPNDPAIVLDYSNALLDDGSASGARIAQGLLKPLLNDDSEPSLYRAYGHACHVAGDDIHAGIAYADAAFLSGRAADALGQLQRLLKRKDLDYYARAQIDARIAQITPIVLEMRRRHMDQDQGNGDDGSGLRFGVCAGPACTQP